MMWVLFATVFGFGAAGGLINSLLTDGGFEKPMYKMEIWQPGFIGNMLIGGVAAVISWGLYGPLSNVVMMGTAANATNEVGLTLSTIVGAVLIGISGARVISNEVDKRNLRVSGSMMMKKNDPEMAVMFETEKPGKLLDMAMHDDQPAQQQASG